ncbi:MAG: hypothetical protein GY810_11800 [Aureispira sp.]|nr:hypothetical protein [Aureispira sp.]
MKQLSGLKSLELDVIEGEWPSFLSQFINLKYLCWNGNVRVLPKYLINFKELETFVLQAAQIEDMNDFVAIIDQLPNLDELRINESKTFATGVVVDTNKLMNQLIKTSVNFSEC